MTSKDKINKTPPAEISFSIPTIEKVDSNLEKLIEIIKSLKGRIEVTYDGRKEIIKDNLNKVIIYSYVKGKLYYNFGEDLEKVAEIMINNLTESFLNQRDPETREGN